MSHQVLVKKVNSHKCTRCGNKVPQILKKDGTVEERARCQTCGSTVWNEKPVGRKVRTAEIIQEKFAGKTDDIKEEYEISSKICHNCDNNYWPVFTSDGIIINRRKCPFCNVPIKGVE